MEVISNKRDKDPTNHIRSLIIRSTRQIYSRNNIKKGSKNYRGQPLPSGYHMSHDIQELFLRYWSRHWLSCPFYKVQIDQEGHVLTAQPDVRTRDLLKCLDLGVVKPGSTTQTSFPSCPFFYANSHKQLFLQPSYHSGSVHSVQGQSNLK